MLITAIIFTVMALLGGYVAFMANAMSDSPSTPFQGASLFIVPAVIAIVFFAMWLGGFHFNLISRG